MAKRNILIVDDEPQGHELVVNCLGSERYQYVSAFDVDEAVARFNEGTFDVVFADFFGPGESLLAISLIPRLREADQKTPIILFSALRPRYADVATAASLGAHYYLAKTDFTEQPQEVLLTIEDAVRPRRQAADVEQLFPLPLAFLYRDTVRNFVEPWRKLNRVLELFDVWVRFMAFVTIAAGERREPLPTDLMQPSLGHWSREFLARSQRVQGTTIGDHVAAVGRKKRVRQAINRLTELRNNLAHGARPGRAAAEQQATTAQELVEGLMHASAFLQQCHLFAADRARMHPDQTEYEVRSLRGSNPKILTERLVLPGDPRLLDGRVYLADRSGAQCLDMYPFLIFRPGGTAEQESVFMYRALRNSQISAEDHVYGQHLTTHEGVALLRAWMEAG